MQVKWPVALPHLSLKTLESPSTPPHPLHTTAHAHCSPGPCRQRITEGTYWWFNQTEGIQVSRWLMERSAALPSWHPAPPDCYWRKALILFTPLNFLWPLLQWLSLILTNTEDWGPGGEHQNTWHWLSKWAVRCGKPVPLAMASFDIRYLVSIKYW